MHRSRIGAAATACAFGENDKYWLHVTVEPTSPIVFTFDQRIVAANRIQH